MLITMQEWETHRPATAEEERLGKAHESSDEQRTPETREVALNPRIRALMAARDEAERKLQEAILDLETREQSSAFQKAKELLDSQKRLSYNEMYDLPKFVFGPRRAVEEYGLDEQGDEAYEFIIHRTSGDANGPGDILRVASNENLSGLYEAMGIAERQDKGEVARYLLNLTEEED